MKKYLIVAESEGEEYLLAETDSQRVAEDELYWAVWRGAEESFIVTDYSAEYYKRLIKGA